MTKLAEAVVEIRADDSPFKQGLASTHSQLKGFVGRCRRYQSAFTRPWPRPASEASQQLASPSPRTSSSRCLRPATWPSRRRKTGARFDDSAGVITAAADVMAAKFGTSRQVFVDGAVNLGLIAKGSGMAQDEAAKFGVQFAKLADDISSFDNVSVEEAMIALRAGLVGEIEPLERFGVTILETNTIQEAFRLGLGQDEGRPGQPRQDHGARLAHHEGLHRSRGRPRAYAVELSTIRSARPRGGGRTSGPSWGKAHPGHGRGRGRLRRPGQELAGRLPRHRQRLERDGRGLEIGVHRHRRDHAARAGR